MDKRVVDQFLTTYWTIEENICWGEQKKDGFPNNSAAVELELVIPWSLTLLCPLFVWFRPQLPDLEMDARTRETKKKKNVPNASFCNTVWYLWKRGMNVRNKEQETSVLLWEIGFSVTIIQIQYTCAMCM